jgi:hypothetical protein
MARRHVRVPKALDKLISAACWGGGAWLVLIHLFACPHAPAMVISCIVGGLALGLSMRRPALRWRIGPVRVSVGSPRRTRSRGGRR